MRARVQKLLQPIIDELNGGGKDAQDLWDILTALRGPDASHKYYEVSSLKDETTAKLRYAIGLRPNPQQHVGRPSLSKFGAIVKPGVPTVLVDAREIDELVGPHFRRHYNFAIQALNNKEGE